MTHDCVFCTLHPIIPIEVPPTELTKVEPMLTALLQPECNVKPAGNMISSEPVAGISFSVVTVTNIDPVHPRLSASAG